MWSSLWRSRPRFSVDELRHLNDQLQKIHIVNNTNKCLVISKLTTGFNLLLLKDFVIETLRSIAELVTYGDQHDPSFFEFFMEKQVMSQFLRVLKISKTESIAIQLLQTLSIMIQNLQSEQAIYYLFSNGHVNNLILYPFDFNSEELLNYYIYFLRTVSGKLDKNTISLLVKTQNDEVISFPLYSEAIKFVHHEENMVRIAVRALTLNIYHVSDEFVHKFITSSELAGYFLDLVKILRQQCFKLDAIVVNDSKTSDSSKIVGKLHAKLAEIGENLCYSNDIICAGVPCLSKLMTHHLLHSLFLTILLPSLHSSSVTGTSLCARTSLYLLSFILREVQFKDLVNSIGAALLCPHMMLSLRLDSECNGHESTEGLSCGTRKLDQETTFDAETAMDLNMQKQDKQLNTLDSSATYSPNCTLEETGMDEKLSLREVLLLYISSENEKLISGSLSTLICLFQNKELDESILDALGILPERKQHKKLLLQALMGSKSDEEQLFSPTSTESKDDTSSDLGLYIQSLKDQYDLPISNTVQGMNQLMHRYQVLDALIRLLCRRPPPAADVLWLAGCLLRQLHPYQKQNFSAHHLNLLDDAYKEASTDLLKETKDCWCDLISAVILDEWKNCKTAIERPDLEKASIFVLLPELQSVVVDGDRSSSFVGQRMRNTVKVFVLHHYLRSSLIGGSEHNIPEFGVPSDANENSRVRRAGIDILVPKIGTEVNLDDALPCRIAFERGKERPFYFLAVAKGKSGCLLLAEEVPLKQHRGIVRVAAPLAGSIPRVDEKHPRWLHLRVRPVNLSDSTKNGTSSGRSRSKGLVDGRWTLAFPDEQVCKAACSIVLEEMAIQSFAVQEELKPLLSYGSPLIAKEDILKV
ncbi:protein TRANSPARENT TESTA 9 isoform X2 [Cryptomeria japonica]|uniref:protein TRANSPARENT TESTA 9 isoform X2 n=1 Tax=Cryptomeria japonica TaxID=3369 RepID=UPI0027DA3672|nr:protein TRANSPARENT TESTA 9 isoform X2 [Cryptomeria japonica]